MWCDGMAGWQLAGAVPEVAVRLASPIPRVAPPPPTPAPPDALGQEGEESIATVLATASQYRRLVVLVGLQMLAGIAIQVLNVRAPVDVQPLVALLGLLVGIGFAIAMAATAHHLMSLLDEGVPILWAIAMFVPIVGLVTLLVISSKAQAWCRKRGIDVGLLGPSQASLDWIRRG